MKKTQIKTKKKTRMETKMIIKLKSLTQVCALKTDEQWNVTTLIKEGRGVFLQHFIVW